MSGPYFQQLLATLASVRDLRLRFWLLSPTKGYLRATLTYPAQSKSRWWVEATDATGRRKYDPESAEAYLLALARDWPDASPLLDRVEVHSAQKPKTVVTQFCQALCELFHQPIPEAKKLPALRETAHQATLARRAAVVAALRQGGAATWTARPAIEMSHFTNLEGVDLAGADLRGIDFASMSLGGVNFTGADLREAWLVNARMEKAILRNANLAGAHMSGVQCSGVDATKADLHGAELWESDWTDAILRAANLEGAICNSITLLGTDLTGANLTGVVGDEATYDVRTRFPDGFLPGPTWSGPPVGPAPVAEELDFASFFSRLRSLVDASRLQKAVAMLKAERFQLFAEVSDAAVLGVVRSQSTAGRVYACRLTSAGQYECGTQNLRPCGALQGEVCKHLLVLLLGLTRTNNLNPGTTYLWLRLAHRQKPTFDKGSMTATFLKYKGVEVGTVDWRPTETIPEDYYACDWRAATVRSPVNAPAG
jgi:hypothetical protein